MTEEFRKTNLCQVGSARYIDWDAVEDNVKARLIIEGYDEDIPIDERLINELGIEHLAGDCVFDDDAILWELGGILKSAESYLVMAHNCCWDGSSGYMITDDLKEAFRRRYEASIYPVSVSRNGKCLICREHSHDVPGGARTSIIALTEAERKRLQKADWDTVAKFAEKCERKAG